MLKIRLKEFQNKCQSKFQEQRKDVADKPECGEGVAKSRFCVVAAKLAHGRQMTVISNDSHLLK